MVVAFCLELQSVMGTEAGMGRERAYSKLLLIKRLLESVSDFCQLGQNRVMTKCPSRHFHFRKTQNFKHTEFQANRFTEKTSDLFFFCTNESFTFHTSEHYTGTNEDSMLSIKETK